jgi:hypothetical protein
MYGFGAILTLRSVGEIGEESRFRRAAQIFRLAGLDRGVSRLLRGMSRRLASRLANLGRRAPR